MKNDIFIHPTAEVKTKSIGEGSTIWQSVVILDSAVLGAFVNVCAHCFIENDVKIGNQVTIKSGVYLWDGIEIMDNVFIGPNVTFTNDKFPRSKQYPVAFSKTIIESGASIGAGAVILPGIRIGQNSMIGAGAVVTKSVPPNAIVYGSPARIHGYVEQVKNDQVILQSSADLNTTQQKVQLTNVSNVTLHNMHIAADLRGSLSVGVFENDIPFNVKRYFLVYDVPSYETRGEHAHKLCHQFLICVKGKCTVVADDGRNRCEIVLERPNLGIYLPPMTWGIQYKYSEDAVLLVFASHEYDSEDYIRDYNDFQIQSGKMV